MKHYPVFADLERELAAHQEDLKLSFGLEYSSVVDWVADLTPRKNHPKARCYGEVWRGQGRTSEEAIAKALGRMREDLAARKKEVVFTVDREPPIT